MKNIQNLVSALALVVSIFAILLYMQTKEHDHTELATRLELQSAISGLVTSSDLASTIAGFVTKSDLQSVVSGFATKADVQTAISGAVTESELQSAIAGLVTGPELNAAISKLPLGSVLHHAALLSEASTRGDPDNNVHNLIMHEGRPMPVNKSICFLTQVRGKLNTYGESSDIITIRNDGGNWGYHLVGADLGAHFGCIWWD